MTQIEDARNDFKNVLFYTKQNKYLSSYHVLLKRPSFECNLF